MAVILFKDLIASTALIKVKEEIKLSRNFITDSWHFDKMGFVLPISLSTCFRFSDFYRVCKDLVHFSKMHFNADECSLIEDKLDVILDNLCTMFIELYEESLELHFTAAIQKDPFNVDAYQERVHAHFEMNNLDLAIEDYKKAKSLEEQTRCTVKSIKSNRLISKKFKMISIDYCTGFSIGVTKGCSVSLSEFFPAAWGCCKGILHGLWAFAWSLIEISKKVKNNLITASYELIQFIQENTTKECLETVVPELKDLCISWHALSDYKGSRTGYIIGKYGLDVLAPAGAIKGIKKYQQLKRLNSMYTVECCIASESMKAKILEVRSQYSSNRTVISNLIKSGKIIPQNPNVIPHIIQKKHAWERVIQLTGNLEEDFKKVVLYLEEKIFLKENDILLDNFLLDQTVQKFIVITMKFKSIL